MAQRRALSCLLGTFNALRTYTGCNFIATREEEVQNNFFRAATARRAACPLYRPELLSVQRNGGGGARHSRQGQGRARRHQLHQPGKEKSDLGMVTPWYRTSATRWMCSAALTKGSTCCRALCSVSPMLSRKSSLDGSAIMPALIPARTTHVCIIASVLSYESVTRFGRVWLWYDALNLVVVFLSLCAACYFHTFSSRTHGRVRSQTHYHSPAPYSSIRGPPHKINPT